jgi:hypothetical protein
MNKRFLSAVLAIQSLVFVSCNQQPDNTAQIKGLEDRIRELEDQEKQLQLQNEQGKLAADRAALEAEKQKFQDQQNAAAQATPASTLSSGDSPPPRKSVRIEEESDSRIADKSPADSYNVFYEGLQSDGRWFNDDKYGYVWQPSEAERDESWRPYTDGHWAYTDRGWTWVSNENFGWATYHYGRWARVRNVGWIWVPGNTWAPAWVSWRQTEQSDYIGWAPLPPECESSPSVKVEGWVDNYYDIGPAAYIFLKAVDLVRPTYRQAILSPEQNLTIIDHTRNVTNIRYNNNVVTNYGPEYQQLAQLTNNRLERYQINYQQQTRPDAKFRTVVTGNQVEVVAPAPQLQRESTVAPKDARQLQNTEVERGWQNIDPGKQQHLKKAFQQNAPPVPKSLPAQPPPPPKPVIAALGSSTPGQPERQAQKPGTPLSSSQISTERQKIEAEKAQLEQQKQALLNGKLPPDQAGTPNQKPAPTAAQVKQAEDQARKQQQADAEKAKQLEAQKAQQADRIQQEAQQKQQAAQQQQQAAAERARQLEAQKAQQADRIQQEAQQKQQAAQQQQQAAAERARQLEAQKAQQADRIQQEAQQRQQVAQQQQQAAAERARQLEAQKAQQADRIQQEAQQRQQAAQQQQQAAAERSKHAEAQKGQKEEEKKKSASTPPSQPQG